MLSAISRVRADGHTLWTKIVPTALNFKETFGILSHGTLSLLGEVQFHFGQALVLFQDPDKPSVFRYRRVSYLLESDFRPFFLY